MIKFFTQYINLYAGIFGGSFLGCIVFYINYDYGTGPAGIAGAKQFVYTFFFGGMFARLCEVLSLKIDQAYFAIINATLVCTFLAGCATFLVHNLKGTPEPWLSTLPTLLTSPIGFIALGWWTQRGFHQETIASEEPSASCKESPAQ